MRRCRYWCTGIAIFYRISWVDCRTFGYFLLLAVHLAVVVHALELVPGRWSCLWKLSSPGEWHHGKESSDPAELYSGVQPDSGYDCLCNHWWPCSYPGASNDFCQHFLQRRNTSVYTMVLLYSCCYKIFYISLIFLLFCSLGCQPGLYI